MYAYVYDIQNRTRFEWIHAWHLNGFGHELFAQGLARSRLYGLVSLIEARILTTLTWQGYSSRRLASK